jgi:hypothetical protein
MTDVEVSRIIDELRSEYDARFGELGCEPGIVQINNVWSDVHVTRQNQTGIRD